MYKQTLFSKLLKEPLLHFLLIGFALFFLFAQLNSEDSSSNKPQIIIQKSTLAQLSITFKEDNGRVPTKIEREVLLDTEIRKEVLYHEAMAMGLDKEDKVIRHRMAEKMSYLFEDVSMMDEPSDAMLKAYREKNPEKFLASAKYAEIKSELRLAWIAKAQQEENQLFYESLKSRYDIVMDDIK